MSEGLAGKISEPKPSLELKGNLKNQKIMINYYFFRLYRERNLQGELRAVLHALPNQQTYDPSSRSIVPVNTNLKVQVPSAINSVVVRSATGDIFGVEICGSTLNRTRLPLYSRNEDKFYRVEELVKAENFSPSMIAAFENVMGASSQMQTPLQADPDAQAPVAQNLENTTFLSLSQMISSKAFIGAVKDCVDTDTTLALSRLHDKMMLGVVKFSYRKSSDDSVREAFGTLNRDIIARLRGANEDDDERRSRGEADGSHFFYFDIERKAIRNFCTENFLSFENCIYNANVETVNEAA